MRPDPPHAGERRNVPPQAIYDRGKNNKKNPAINVSPAPAPKGCTDDDWGWCRQFERTMNKQR